jgi:hypothetical protein
VIWTIIGLGYVEEKTKKKIIINDLFGYKIKGKEKTRILNLKGYCFVIIYFY